MKLFSALLLGAALSASPLAADMDPNMPMGHHHGNGPMTDAIKLANSYCLIINRDSGDVNLYEVATGKSNRIFLDKFASPHMGMISHDGRTLVVSGTGSNIIYLIDVATQKIMARIPAYGEPEHMDITPDSKYVFCGSMQGGVVQAIDLTTYSEAKAIDGFHEPHGYSTLPDGSKIYISNIGAHEVTVVDVNRLEVLKRISVSAPTDPSTLNPSQYLNAINGIVNPTLTQDGKLVEVDASLLAANSKKISDKELQNWMNSK